MATFVFAYAEIKSHHVTHLCKGLSALLLFASVTANIRNLKFLASLDRKFGW